MGWSTANILPKQCKYVGWQWCVCNLTHLKSTTQGKVEWKILTGILLQKPSWQVFMTLLERQCYHQDKVMFLLNYAPINSNISKLYAQLIQISASQYLETGINHRLLKKIISIHCKGKWFTINCLAFRDVKEFSHPSSWECILAVSFLLADPWCDEHQQD